MAGKMVEAAIPKARATVPAAKPGGFRPSQPATMATAMAILPAISSPFSLMSGMMAPLIRSCDTADEMASSRPAAVDSAAARPPAATSAITQLGSSAISGLASTMMSAFTVSSLPFQPAASALALARLRSWWLVVVVLDAAVAVLVFELQQAGLFPALHPVRTLFVLEAGFRLRFGAYRSPPSDHRQAHCGVDGGVQVQLGHGAHGRSRGVQQWR
jgi:hypothetical protein